MTVKIIEIFRMKLMLKPHQNVKIFSLLRRYSRSEVEKFYDEEEKAKMLKVINDIQDSSEFRYEISKPRLTNIKQWKVANGEIKSIGDIELMKGFTDKATKQLCDSIINNEHKIQKLPTLRNILHPPFKSSKSCRSVLAVHVTSFSICWALIDRSFYEVLQWEYCDINFGEQKNVKFTDIYDIVWKAYDKMPAADVYVMQGETGLVQSKNLRVNVQKLQTICMIVALINSRQSNQIGQEDNDGKGKNKIHFLGPSLPYRLYDVFIGNERVSTLKTIDDILQKANVRTSDNSHVYIPKDIQNKFKRHRELQRDMLGQCLLMALTFMDVCVYFKEDSRKKLSKKLVASS